MATRRSRGVACNLQSKNPNSEGKSNGNVYSFRNWTGKLPFNLNIIDVCDGIRNMSGYSKRADFLQTFQALHKTCTTDIEGLTTVYSCRNMASTGYIISKIA